MLSVVLRHLGSYSMSRRVLVVAAHTDDEALGCGGTIAKHVAQGDGVYAIFLADGVSSRPGSNRKEREAREAAACLAQEILGIKKAYSLGFPDNKLDTIPLLEIIQSIENLAAKIEPDIVYTHSHSDLNIDHQIVNKAVLTAFRPTPNQSVSEIYTMEVLSSSEWNNPLNEVFKPNYYVEITDYLDKKLSALKKYDKEMREAPHSRSYENVINLAKYRGMSIGMMAAEAFEVIRIVNKS